MSHTQQLQAVWQLGLGRAMLITLVWCVIAICTLGAQVWLRGQTIAFLDSSNAFLRQHNARLRRRLEAALRGQPDAGEAHDIVDDEIPF